MRTFKIFGIFLSAVLTVFGMTSCFNSDDNSNQSLTKEQIQQCYFAVAGPHSGKLVYVAGKANNGNSKTDSIPASWNITSDSTMVLNNVSAKAVASLIDTTSAEHKEIRNAIAAQPSKPMNCFCHDLIVAAAAAGRAAGQLLHLGKLLFHVGEARAPL